MGRPLKAGPPGQGTAHSLGEAPWLFGFSRNKAATVNAVVTGAAHLGLSLMTRYPLGVFKLVPWPVHGVIESFAGGMTATAPFLFGFADNARACNVFLTAGLGTFGVVAITDYSSDRTGYATGERDEALPEAAAGFIGDVSSADVLGAGERAGVGRR